MTTMFKTFAADTKGATAIEYGLIAVAAVTAMGTLGNKISTTLNNTAGKMVTK